MEKTSASKVDLADLAIMLRSARYRTGLAMLVFVGIIYLLYYAVGKSAYASYAGWVWVVFAGMLAYGWLTSATLAWMLQSDKKHFIKITDLNTYVHGWTPQQIYDLVTEVGRKCGIEPKQYTIYVVEDETQNAFAAGTGSSQMIALHKGLFTLTAEQIRGVVAHECGHLINKDIFFLIFASASVMTFILVGKFFWNSWLYGGLGKSEKDKGKENGGVSFLGIAIASFIIGYLLAPIIMAFMSRQREKIADGYAAACGYGRQLQDALKKLGESTAKTAPAKSAVASLYINAPKAGFLDVLVSSHPSIDSRVVSIDKMMDGKRENDHDLLSRIVRWVIFPLAVLVLVVYTGVGSDLPNFMGVPYALVAAAVFGLAAESLNEMINAKPVQQSAEKTVQDSYKGGALIGLYAFSVAILIGMWAVGMLATHLSAPLVGTVIPFALIAPVAFWVWIGKPVTAALGTQFGIFGVISDLTSAWAPLYASLMIWYFVILAVVKMF